MGSWPPDQLNRRKIRPEINCLGDKYCWGSRAARRFDSWPRCGSTESSQVLTQPDHHFFVAQCASTPTGKLGTGNNVSANVDTGCPAARALPVTCILENGGFSQHEGTANQLRGSTLQPITGRFSERPHFWYVDMTPGHLWVLGIGGSFTPSGGGAPKWAVQLRFIRRNVCCAAG